MLNTLNLNFLFFFLEKEGEGEAQFFNQWDKCINLLISPRMI
jgi:hypothetical protein